MLYETAARVSEILALNVEDLDLEQRPAPIRSLLLRPAARGGTKVISFYRIATGGGGSNRSGCGTSGRSPRAGRTPSSRSLHADRPPDAFSLRPADRGTPRLPANVAVPWLNCRNGDTGFGRIPRRAAGLRGVRGRHLAGFCGVWRGLLQGLNSGYYRRPSGLMRGSRGLLRVLISVGWRAVMAATARRGRCGCCCGRR